MAWQVEMYAARKRSTDGRYATETLMSPMLQDRVPSDTALWRPPATVGLARRCWADGMRRCDQSRARRGRASTSL
jgi:hypothetical protein